jgi:murein DD-endopeptidase MepM/ murein hydrolase activator NlpD
MLVLLSAATLAAAVMLSARFSEWTAKSESWNTAPSAKPPSDSRLVQLPETSRPKAAPHRAVTPPAKTPPSNRSAKKPPIDLSDIGPPLAALRASEILDTFHQARDGGERKHEAVDLMAPRGTPVLAMTTGVVKRLFHSKPGGLTVYQFDGDEEYCYYYAHLDRYADGLEEGEVLERGSLVGYVGSTGNAPESAPHLHLAIFRLGPGKQWWEGTPINPYPILIGLVARSEPTAALR